MMSFISTMIWRMSYRGNKANKIHVPKLTERAD